MATTNPTETELISRTELRFLMHEWLEVGRLTGTGRYNGATTEDYDEVVELAQRIAADRFAPHLRLGDRHPPQIGDRGLVELPPEIGSAIDAFAAAGLFGVSLDTEVGGMALPRTVAMAAYACFHVARVSHK